MDVEIKLRDNSILVLPTTDRVAAWSLLSQTYLEKSDFQKHSYQGLLLAGLNLTSANLIKADFSNCDLTGVVLNQTLAERAKFVGSKVRVLSLDNTNLAETDFTEASLSVWSETAKSVNATGAVFCNASITVATFLNTLFVGAVFEGAHLNGVGLQLCTASRSRYDNASLDEVRFKETNLQEASFRKAHLQNSVFQGCDLSNADFAGADLKGTTFFNCDFTGVSFRDAKNIPEMLYENNHSNPPTVLFNRARAEGHNHVALEQAFRRLWFERLVVGGDLLTEPFDKVTDAALAIADAIAPETSHDVL